MANACFSQNLGHRWSVVIIPAPKSFSTSHLLASKHHALAYASIELSSDSPQVKGEEPCRPSSPGPHAQKMTGAIIPESDSLSYVSNRCTIIRFRESFGACKHTWEGSGNICPWKPGAAATPRLNEKNS